VRGKDKGNSKVEKRRGKITKRMARRESKISRKDIQKENGQSPHQSKGGEGEKGKKSSFQGRIVRGGMNETLGEYTKMGKFGGRNEISEKFTDGRNKHRNAGRRKLGNLRGSKPRKRRRMEM